VDLRHMQETVLHPNESHLEASVVEEGECAKEICVGMKKGHYPNTRRKRNGGYKDTRNPLDNPPQRKQGHPSGQLYTQGCHARRLRCTSNYQSTRLLRMMSTSWKKRYRSSS
jgi:hypothetical protein